MNPNKEDLKRDFVDCVSYLLQSNQSEGTALYNFLLHYSKRFQNPHIDVHEVIVEGVKRGIEWIGKNGEAIIFPEAWLRITCLNILKDEVKYIVKTEQKSERLSQISCSEVTHPLKPELIDQLEFLDCAMKKLSEDDRLLIHLRFFKNKNYDQIQRHYELFHGESISLPALRKRESRAMKKLKEHFFVLYQEGSIQPK